MDINILGIVLVVIFASFAWWANDTLNKVPTIRPIIQVLIVLLALICILYYCGLGGNLHTHIHIN